MRMPLLICGLASMLFFFSVIYTEIDRRNQPTFQTSPVPLENHGELTTIYKTSKITKHLSIRVLICRHTPEQMAINDANLTKRGVDAAAAKGLDIKTVDDVLVRSLDDFNNAVQNNIVKNSVPGDTLIIHTIGHGFRGGGLQRLGQRRQVMKSMVDAAQENQQEVIWWQLSCYANSDLPHTEDDLFSNIATSSANRQSPTGVHGRIMAKVFMALAMEDSKIDPDGDGAVTAHELKNFMNGIDSQRRGDLVFARSSDEVIFGSFGPWLIPIHDWQNPYREFDRRYIPIPRRRY